MFIMAGVSHLHSASHSARYLLIVFIFTFIDFLICLLAFLIDVLLFVPHLAWGSYIVLAATILVALSGVVACVMRRTLISRKDRQKRVAENPEMSGENYYNSQAQSKVEATELARQPTLPTMSGGGGGGGATNDSLPTFATFEQNNKSDQVSDERIPLTNRSPSERSPNPASSEMAGAAGVAALHNAPTRSRSRDQFGNPIDGPVDGQGVRRGPSNERMNSRGRGDLGGYRGGRGGGYARGGYENYSAPARGRGGYGPAPGRGGYGPRGGRGGYGPPPRGGYGPGGMRGAQSPPPGYNGSPGPYDRRPSPADVYAVGAYGRQPSEDPSSNNYSSTNVYSSTNPSMPSVNAGYSAYNPDTNDLPRAESPPPLPGTQPATVGGQPIGGQAVGGQAVEMEAAPIDQQRQYGQYDQLRDNDSDVAGMVNLQQGQLPARQDTHLSQGSRYADKYVISLQSLSIYADTYSQYVPPRAEWNEGSGRNSPRAPSPYDVHNRTAAELPAGRGTPSGPRGGYYEDVDPRFASNTPPEMNNQLAPPVDPIYEDIHLNNPGARSPADSDRSNFTSISQRGVNPRWNPNPPPMPYQQGPPTRRPVRQQQQRQDMLLDNPDFQLPGQRSNNRRGGPGMIPGSAYPV